MLTGDLPAFDLDTVKLLMSIFDTDRSGTIGFNEFAGLWKYVKDWQNVFRHFDRDRSGTIDNGELRDALGQFGYNLSPPLLELVQKKYGEPLRLYFCFIPFFVAYVHACAPLWLPPFVRASQTKPLTDPPILLRAVPSPLFASSLTRLDTHAHT